MKIPGRGKLPASADHVSWIQKAVEAIPDTICNCVWGAQQRQQDYTYRRDINELRQRKKAIMVATAEHANIGDSAITLAEQYFLSQYFPEYFQVEISTYEFSQKESFLHAILNPGDILFLNGGGNLGDRYMGEEELHRKIVSEFPNQKIIIFPQTIFFSDTEQGRRELEKSAKIYNSHRDLTLYVRGEINMSLARAYFAGVNVVLMPDMVHILRSNYGFDRNGILLCLRNDEEGKLNQEQRETVIRAANAAFETVNRTTNMHSGDVSRENRGFVVRSELMRFARHQLVVTDRLHGMIFSAVTGTPCVVFSSGDHKIKDYYHTFFRDSNAVFYVGESVDILEEAIGKAVSVTNPSYPIFDQEPFAEIRNRAFDSRQ